MLHRQPNRGLSETLNQALRLATGEWFGWLNADDFYLPSALVTVRRAIEEYPDADMIWGDCVYVDAQGRFLRLVAQHPTNRRVLRLMGTHIAPCATFVRRAALPSWIFDSQSPSRPGLGLVIGAAARWLADDLVADAIGSVPTP